MTDTERPARNAKTKEWRDYATAVGLPLEDGRSIDDYSRDELVELADRTDVEAEQGQQIAGPNTTNPTGDESYDTIDRSHPGADPETGRLATQPHVPADGDEGQDDDDVDELGDAEDADGADFADPAYTDVTEGSSADVTWDDPDGDEGDEYGTFTHQTPGE